jgi:hypothetical protein
VIIHDVAYYSRSRCFTVNQEIRKSGNQEIRKSGNQDQRGSTIMKSFFAVLLVMLGFTGQPVFADILPAVCGNNIAEADPKPKPDDEEPDCE